MTNDQDKHCIGCGLEWSEAVECCCDHGTNEDGTHVDGHCKQCCPAHSWKHRDDVPAPEYYRDAATLTGMYDRGDV